MKTTKVAIIMGSASDYPIMKEAEAILKDFSISTHVEVVSAHRTPEKMMHFAKDAKSNGFQVIIAGAGGAAHLPGMVASLTSLPVIGVPIKSSNSIDGWFISSLNFLESFSRAFDISDSYSVFFIDNNHFTFSN